MKRTYAMLLVRVQIEVPAADVHHQPLANLTGALKSWLNRHQYDLAHQGLFVELVRIDTGGLSAATYNELEAKH